MKRDFTPRPFWQKPYGGGNCAIFRKVACIGDLRPSGKPEIAGEESLYFTEKDKGGEK